MEVTSGKFSILLIDDDPLMIAAVRRIFVDDEYAIHSMTNANDALEFLASTVINLTLVDYKMAGMDGIEFVKKAAPHYPDLSIVMLTAYGGVKEAVEAMKAGAVDFIEKPCATEALRARVTQFYKVWKLKQENNELRQQVQTNEDFSGLVGTTEVMVELKKNILQAAREDLTVLIQGESGTGKEVVARLLHLHSPRSFHPFIPVDCGAINETLIENELFGHATGSFTGAYRSNLGLIRSANSGTLFLDEIGELTAAAQVKLLRTLQEREVRPIGSEKRYKVDIRVIAATNRVLDEDVARGSFRQDLFFRLNVFPLYLPALRERKNDIELLARHFIFKYTSKNYTVDEISQEALDYLKDYNWPGNVRELENVMRRSIVLSKGSIIKLDDIVPIFSSFKAAPSVTQESVEEIHPPEVRMDNYEEIALRSALSKHNGNRRKAAQILGISEATLYRKLKKFNIL